MLFSKLIMTVGLMAVGLVVAMPAAEGVVVRDDDAPTGSFSLGLATGTHTRGVRPTGTGGVRPTGTRGPRPTGTRASGTHSRHPRPTGTFTPAGPATETPAVE